jgi:hypothetical protein
MDVHLENSNGVRFVANTDPHLKFTVGDNIKMYVDIGKAHFFEPGDTGSRLLGHVDLKMATRYVQNLSEQTDRAIENGRKYTVRKENLKFL